MYAMTERALQILKGSIFTNPIELLDGIEEPFGEDKDFYVGDMGVRIAADEKPTYGRGCRNSN